MIILALTIFSYLSPIDTIIAALDKPKNENILCVEVGWTRVKAGLLPEKLTFDELKSITTVTFKSDQWLNQSFPILFNKSIAGPLKSLLDQPFKKISLSISGPVIDNRFHPDIGKRGIPENLKDACEKEARCSVIVENDAICWAIGCLEYQKLKAKRINFPCLIITLGTSVGLALALDDHRLYGIEQIYLNSPFKRLEAQIIGQPIDDHRFLCHDALGEPFFHWIFDGKDFSDQQMDAFLPAYNQRFQTYLADISEVIEGFFKIKIASNLVGGGNSRFINTPEKNLGTLFIYSPQAIQAEGISPDMIQLLGCWRLGRIGEKVETRLFPSYELIEKIGDLWEKGKTDSQVNFILGLKDELKREASNPR